ncbi:MAG: PAS domain S-box protein, partial [Nitrospira defluvii]|nr:PAS domain S-box protein [Nitrospira defluvii]
MSALPKGDALAEPAWASRHRGILTVLWIHALGVPLFGRYMGATSNLCLVGGAVLALVAAIAQLPAVPRRLQSAIATCGLMSASALLVHLSGGYIELHFHFFVMMSVIVLDQDWLPFLVGLQFIILDHGLVGTLLPAMVYRHAEGQAHPWTWALIHGAFILAQCATLLYFWRVNEIAQEETLQSETRTRMVIETALDAVMTTDTTGAIREWNTQAELMFDVPRTEAIGKSLTAYLSASFSSTATECPLPHSGLVPGAILNRRVEMLGRRRSGAHFPVEVAMSCLAVGDMQHFTTFVQDISERKEQEEVLRR